MPTRRQKVAVLDGDPHAIGDSARRWLATGDRCEARAGEVRACRVPHFGGDEADRFNTIVDRYADDLDAAAVAWRAGGAALSRYAERLDDCQRRLTGLAAELRCAAGDPGFSGDGYATGRAPDRGVLDPEVTRRFRAAAGNALAEHADAVRRCRTELDVARGFLPGGRAPEAGDITGPTPAWSPQWSSRVVGGGGLRAVSAALKTAAGQTALVAPAAAHHVSGLDGFFSELDALLGAVGMALTVLGTGGGGGGALALAGGAGVAAAAPPVAVSGAAIAGAAVAGAALGILIASIVEGESPQDEIADALSGNKIAGTPTIDMHGLAKLNRSEIPPDVLKEVDDAIARAKIGKKRFPGHDGEEWEDRKHQLPPAPPDYYKEWTAAPNGAGRGWDQPHRVIIGGDAKNPDAIYYWDHTDAAPVYIGP